MAMDSCVLDEELFPGLMMADSQISELDLAPEKPRTAPTATRNKSRTTTAAAATATARHPNSSSSDRKPRRTTTTTTTTRLPKGPLPNSGSRKQQHRRVSPPEQPFMMGEEPPSVSNRQNNHNKNGSSSHDNTSDSWEEDDMVDARDLASYSPSYSPSTNNSYYTSSSPPPSYRSSNSNRNHYQQQQQQQPTTTATATATAEERLTHLARLCVAASGRLVTVARDNRHLAVEAGTRLDAYVLRPCLRAGAGFARTYCPEGLRALREAEAQVRRVVAGGVGGAGHRRGNSSSSGGGGGSGEARGLLSEKELLRLKDRLVEQDVLLRDWHLYSRRLMRERDILRKRLSSEGGELVPLPPGEGVGNDEVLEQQKQRRKRSRTPQFRTPCASAHGDGDGGGDGNGDGDRDGDAGIEENISRHATTATRQQQQQQQQKQQQQQLAEQLRQLQMIVDQLALHEVLNDENDGDDRYDYEKDYYGGRDSPAERDKKISQQPNADGGSDDEDWTML
ncbi:hypothetical protein UCREL1_5139 [Eutypa lata UCREL1]|uniref:Uncharacterized protein n=1 Tax=Eutypa lata (strain UCR-EL1) TaxID=1287681 RepID=M7STL7_EUTLA|nr:hypothetical protein UCREL1_5139 [Eutypa lata UCREL1]